MELLIVGLNTRKGFQIWKCHRDEYEFFKKEMPALKDLQILDPNKVKIKGGEDIYKDVPYLCVAPQKKIQQI